MKINFDGYLVDGKNANQLCQEIYTSLNTNNHSTWLACINPHSYVTACRDEVFSRSLKASNWLVPDGVGVNLFSSIVGEKLQHRVTGWDIFYGLSDIMNKDENKTVYFLGSTEETRTKIIEFMHQEFPNVTVVGGFSPPFKENFNEVETSEMVTRINSVSPDVLWVGLTAPKQEKWLHANIDSIDVKFAGAIGAVFDFCSGNVKRAPNWMQRFGIEWLHRSLSSPYRLGKRNIISNPIFIYIMIKKWLSRVGLTR